MVSLTQLCLTLQSSLQLNCIWHSRGPFNSAVFDFQAVFESHVFATNFFCNGQEFPSVPDTPFSGWSKEYFLTFHRENKSYLFLFIGKKKRKRIFAREELWHNVKNSKDPATCRACQSRAAFLLLSVLVV